MTYRRPPTPTTESETSMTTTEPGTIREQVTAVLPANAYVTADLIQQADDAGTPTGVLDDARVLLAEAAKLIAAMGAIQRTTWQADADRWLELHEAYFAGAPLPRADHHTTFCAQCGAHLALGHGHFNSCPIVDPAITQPRAHEDADPGRPADMMPATGGVWTGGPLVSGSAGCVLDVQEPNRVAPINSAYASDLDRERYNRDFLHRA